MITEAEARPFPGRLGSRTLSRMDPELKALLTALAEGQIKLAEGQAAFARDVKAALGELTLAQAHTQVALTDLAGDVRTLGERMDKYAEAVVRGFTNGAERNGKLARRVEVVETRLDRIEKRLPPPGRKKG